MTIAAAYLTSEGVVLGADSTTTISAPTSGTEAGPVVQILNHAQKIFEVGAPGQGNFGVCTWGAGRLETMSHRTLFARLSDQLDKGTTVEQAKDLSERRLITYIHICTSQSRHTSFGSGHPCVADRLRLHS